MLYSTSRLINNAGSGDGLAASNANDLSGIKIKFDKTITYKIPGLDNTEGTVGLRSSLSLLILSLSIYIKQKLRFAFAILVIDG